jgi:hypothetical protein
MPKSRCGLCGRLYDWLTAASEPCPRCRQEAELKARVLAKK